MKITGKAFTGLGLTLLLAAGAAFSVLHFQTADATEASEAQAPQVMPVAVSEIREEDIMLWRDFSGRLQAVDFVELRPQVSGSIQEIKFEDGQIVNAGDVLFVIDPRPYEASVNQAQAELEAAKEHHALSQKELGRAQELVKNDAIPKRIFDERQNNARVSKSQVAAADARLAQAKINLDHAHVKAPISGRVSRAEITLGNLVQAGPNAPVLTTIVSHEGIYADFEIDEQTYLQNIRSFASDRESEAKIPVELTLQSDSNEVYKGYIHSLDNRIDTTTGTIRARALFKNEGGRLLPGMYVSVRLGAASAEKTITIPETAVGTDQDRKFVYVVSPENIVTYREVKLGASVGTKRVVLSGLAPGDKIIIEGLMKIRPDMPVQPQIVAAEATLQSAPPEILHAPADTVEHVTEDESASAEEPAAVNLLEAVPEAQSPVSP